MLYISKYMPKSIIHNVRNMLKHYGHFQAMESYNEVHSMCTM